MIPYCRGSLYAASSLDHSVHAGLSRHLYRPTTPDSPRPTDSPKALPVESISGLFRLQEERAHRLSYRIPLEVLEIIVTYVADCIGVHKRSDPIFDGDSA